MYALNLNEEKRILSACIVLENGIYTDMPIVETLPEGNIVDYLYVNGEYVYSPLPEPEEPEHEPTEAEITLDLLADHEYRLCMIELGMVQKGELL